MPERKGAQNSTGVNMSIVKMENNKVSTKRIDLSRQLLCQTDVTRWWVSLVFNSTDSNSGYKGVTACDGLVLLIGRDWSHDVLNYRHSYYPLSSGVLEPNYLESSDFCYLSVSAAFTAKFFSKSVFLSNGVSYPISSKFLLIIIY